MLPVCTYINNIGIEDTNRLRAQGSVVSECESEVARGTGTNLALAAKIATEGGCPDYKFKQGSWKRHISRHMSG